VAHPPGADDPACAQPPPRMHANYVWNPTASATESDNDVSMLAGFCRPLAAVMTWRAEGQPGQRSTFLKKKKQNSFVHLARGGEPPRAKCAKSFCFFSPEKEESLLAACRIGVPKSDRLLERDATGYFDST